MDRLCRTDRSMIRWMLKVRLKDRTPAALLLAKLDLQSIETLVQQSRLRWYGHIQRSSDWINKVTKFEVDGTSSRGRPKKTWAQTVKQDMVCWGLEHVDPTDRNIWRHAMRTKKRVQPAQ